VTVDEALLYVREAPSATERELLMAQEILDLRGRRDRAVTRVRLLEARLGMIGEALNYREAR
jgi:hypothetical protein